MTPKRITLSRKKGWSMPADTKKVARPGLYGNPFKAEDVGGNAEAARLFGLWLEGKADAPPGYKYRREDVLAGLPRLNGHNLACWCKQGEPCHADVLLRLANGGGS